MSTPPTPPDAGTPTRITLVALLMTLTLELVRASGPLLERTFAESIPAVGLTVLATYGAAGVVAAALLLTTGRRASGAPSGRTVLIGTVILGAARLTLQALDATARYWAGLATVAIAVAVLTLAVALVAGRSAGGRQAALGLVIGTGLATGVQLALGTWDALWRHTVTGWAVTIVLVAASAWVALAARAHDAVGRPRRLWTLGPYIAITAMMLANPAFAASQGHVALRTGGLVLVVASSIAVWPLLNPHLLRGPVRVTAAIGVPVTVGGALLLDGRAALAAIALLEICTAIAVAGAMSTRRPARLGVTGAAVATTLVGLGLILPVLLYLTDYQVALPVDNVWVAVLAGLAIAIGGLRRRTPTAPGTDRRPDTATAPATAPYERQPFRANAVRLLVLPAIVLAVVGWWTSAGGAVHLPDQTRTDTLTLLDWNVHYGVAPTSDVDLERIARTIEQVDPDVLTLQEVTRGWILGGGTDMATWLAHRLGMQIVFAPAADQQFGNAILARTALTDPVVTTLPYGDGPQDRSALSATVTLADGTPVRVTSAHLQHPVDAGETRRIELVTLLAALTDSGANVLAGDFNAGVGSHEVAQVIDSGWDSAIDDVGDPAALTFSSDHPTDRIDWVFTRDASATSAQVLSWSHASDHLPVLVTLTVPR